MFDKLAVTKATKLYRQGKLQQAYQSLFRKIPLKTPYTIALMLEPLERQRYDRQRPMTLEKYLKLPKWMLPTRAPITMGERTKTHGSRECQNTRKN